MASNQIHPGGRARDTYTTRYVDGGNDAREVFTGGGGLFRWGGNSNHGTEQTITAR